MNSSWQDWKLDGSWIDLEEPCSYDGNVDQRMLGLAMQRGIILVEIHLLQVKRHSHVVPLFPLFMQPFRNLKFLVLLALTQSTQFRLQCIPGFLILGQ